MLKVPGENPGVLGRDHWSQFAGIGWKTVTYGCFQPVLKVGFPVVIHDDTRLASMRGSSDVVGLGNRAQKVSSP